MVNLLALQAATERADQARKALADAEKEAKALRTQVLKTSLGKTLLQSGAAKPKKKKKSSKKSPDEAKKDAKTKVKEGSGVTKPKKKKTTTTTE